MKFLEKERQKLLKKTEWLMHQNKLDEENIRAELDEIEKLFDSFGDNPTFLMIAKDAIKEANEILEDKRSLKKAKELLEKHKK